MPRPPMSAAISPVLHAFYPVELTCRPEANGGRIEVNEQDSPP